MSRNIEGDHTPANFRFGGVTGEKVIANGIAGVALYRIEFVERIVLARSDVNGRCDY
jgi:hypothetical protein